MTRGARTQVTKTPVRRRTQIERSDAMRRRLLAATLQRLAEDGYNGATLSSIVQLAGVSRGAQVHHFPSKHALMLEAAEDLFRGAYRTLGEVLLAIVDESDRLQALVEALWTQLFTTPAYQAYKELLHASQRDDALRGALASLLKRQIAIFEVAIDHYFEPAPGAARNIRQVFFQMYMMLSGLAAHAHLQSDPKALQAQLRAWVRQSASHVRARRGVRSPPPRPRGPAE